MLNESHQLPRPSGAAVGWGFWDSCPGWVLCLVLPAQLPPAAAPSAPGLGRILLPPFTRGTGKQSQPTLIKTKLKLLNLSYPFEIISLLLVGQSRAKAQLPDFKLKTNPQKNKKNPKEISLCQILKRTNFIPAFCGAGPQQPHGVPHGKGQRCCLGFSKI